MNRKLLILSIVMLLTLIVSASAVSAISTFLYWPDATTAPRTVSSAQDLDFNYTTTLPASHSAITDIMLVKNGDYNNPVATISSISSQGVTFGPETIDSSLLNSGEKYTIWAQAKDTTVPAQDFDLLDFSTANTPPQFSGLSRSYQYDISQVQNVNVVDLAQFASDVDGDPLTFSLDQASTNTNILSCSVPTSVLNCDLFSVGTTTVDVIVSDGTAITRATLTIEVIDSGVNTAPEFDANMQLAYTYNLNQALVNVVDLSSVSSDVDGDPLTFSLDQSSTDPAVVGCQLVASSQLRCNLNGVGTTTLDAIVSDGSLTDRVTIQITVFSNQVNNAPYFNASLQRSYTFDLATTSQASLADLDLFGIDPDGDPLTYSLNTQNTNANVLSCSLFGTLVGCSFFNVGTTTVEARVSDGQAQGVATLTITIIDSSIQNNNPPFFNRSMARSYTYDLAVTQQANVVDLSQFGVDPDNDPVTYSIDTTNTNPSIATCTLRGTVVDCNFNAVGTTTFTAEISDGQVTTSAIITLNVINSTTNNAPFYINVNTVNVQPTGMQQVFDLTANSVDPNGDPVTHQVDLGQTNPSIINNCLIANGNLYCNIVGTGNTVVKMTVSDGQYSSSSFLPINSSSSNGAPRFNGLQQAYQYNINRGNVIVTDLSNFAVDPDGDALSFSIDTSATNTAVVSCSLQSTTIDCNLNGVGTTTLDALVSDGKTTTAVTLTITVFQPGPKAPIAVITSPSHTYTCDEDSVIKFDGSDSYSPDNRPIINYFWTVFKSGDIVASSNQKTWTLDCLEQGRYEVYLSVVDSDGLVGSAQKTMRITREKDFSDSDEDGLKVHSVDVWGIDFETACLGPCGSNQLEVTARVENTNSFPIDNLRMTYTIPMYGIKYKSEQVDLAAGEVTTIELLVDLPYDIAPGVYYPTASFSDGDIRRVKPGYLEILG